MVFVKHILGKFNQEEQIQRCIICGEIIHDYRNAMFAPDENGNIPINKGWIEGEHYVGGKNPTVFWSTKPDKSNEIIECKG